MHGTATLSQADPPPARETRVVGPLAGEPSPFGKQVGMLAPSQPCPRL
jgi:hypothetical protein